jgi:hypothetical protein
MPDKSETQPPKEMPIYIAARVEDIPEIERIAKGVIKVLKKFGGYEPEVDDIWVYRIANCTFYLKKSEYFLDAPTATEHTYSRVTDIQTKQQNMIEHAMEQLALSRRDRIEKQGEADLVRRLREEIEKARNA